mmetsp:Transcript_23292/g.34385  ORF Transcript_23292/g.34385 Transcript_23292/m.34385 type:complete len:255 (+) Transcript_23292:50-814(+)
MMLMTSMLLWITLSGNNYSSSAFNFPSKVTRNNPRNLVIEPILGQDEELVKTSRFFTEAFWASKIGGTDVLTTEQRKALAKQQIKAFRERFGGNTTRNSEIIKCRDEDTGEIVGCVGLEVSFVSLKNGFRTKRPVPFMSNLAIGKKYRREGIAKDLIIAAEAMVRKQWGYGECYLFVEENNLPAVKLYRKIGYKTVAKDETETSLIPAIDGILKNEDVVLLCMKKSFRNSIWNLLSPFRLFLFIFLAKTFLLDM